jgi:septum site-determining protein MinD
MGHESDALYDLSDVTGGRVPLTKAAIKDERAEALWLIPSPMQAAFGETITDEGFAAVIADAEREFTPDFIILDTPGDMGHSFTLASHAADTAVIVTNHQTTSIRAADRTAASIAAFPNIKETLLVINKFDIGNLRSFWSGERLGINEIIDACSVSLLGVVPMSYDVERAQENGVMVDELGGESERAFVNIAKRLNDNSVPLFDGFRRAKRIRHLF